MLSDCWEKNLDIVLKYATFTGRSRHRCCQVCYGNDANPISKYRQQQMSSILVQDSVRGEPERSIWREIRCQLDSITGEADVGSKRGRERIEARTPTWTSIRSRHFYDLKGGFPQLLFPSQNIISGKGPSSTIGPDTLDQALQRIHQGSS